MCTGENFCLITKHIYYVIRKTVLVPGVCLCIHIEAMMQHVHTGEAMMTSDKLCHFLLVTMRLIAHSGGCACIQNCVGEFGMYTGWPLATSKGM